MKNILNSAPHLPDSLRLGFRKRPIFKTTIISLIITVIVLVGLYRIVPSLSMDDNHADQLVLAVGFLAVVLFFMSLFTTIRQFTVAGETQQRMDGYHALLENFDDHFKLFKDAYDLRSGALLLSFQCVISTMAYGVGTKTPKRSTDEFYDCIIRILRHAQKTAQLPSFNKDIQIGFYIWNPDGHRNVFGEMGVGLLHEKDKLSKQRTAVINKLETIRDICREIREDRRKYDKIKLQITYTDEVEWRLFKFETEAEQFGIITLFTPLNNQSVTNQQFATAAYVSRAPSLMRHFGEILRVLRLQSSQYTSHLENDCTPAFLSLDKQSFQTKFFGLESIQDAEK